MRIVSVSPSHDSSVCVLNDGKIEYFFKEERLCGIKKESAPYLSIIEAHKHIKGPVDFCVVASPDTADLFSINHILFRVFNPKQVIDMCSKHHLQHAALAFENSQFDQALVFVIDRNGSRIDDCMRESETVFIARSNSYSIVEIYKNYSAKNFGVPDTEKVQQSLIKLKLTQPNCLHVCRSLFNTTKVYESATTLIGQDPLENGKTMGLSSYGNPINFPDLFLDPLNPDIHLVPTDSHFVQNQSTSIGVLPVSFRDLENSTVKNVPENAYELYADYAKHVQNQTQERITKFIQHYVDKTGINNVVITGGFGMNIVANSYYMQQLPNVKFFFEPIADDTGNSIGAAILIHKQKTDDNENYALKDTFFHGHLHPLDDIKGKTINVSDVADLLLEQKSVAVYQGYAEAGQRALGNRSILFDATNVNAKFIVNKIKNREWYRPFAAMILEEDANEYFDMLGLERNEFMTNSFQVREKYRDLLSGVVHVDGSCRVQTINMNHSLYELLSDIKSKNGIGILLNTSFNLAGYPLVETPQQAIETLNQSKLDYLWFPEIKKIIS
jgi:carbamoyltransferase